MQQNTVQTTIDYIKDITGQTNLSTEKAIRAINFAVDHYSYLALTSSGKWRWDSRNNSDIPRVTTTLAAGETKVLLEMELMAISRVEITDSNGEYKVVKLVDSRDSSDFNLERTYTSESEVVADYDSNHLYFYPVPSENRTVRVTYTRAHPRFTTSDLASAVGVEPIHEEYVALYAADRVMIGVSDSARVAVRNELQVKEKEVRDYFSKRDQTSSRKLPVKLNVIE